MSVNVFNQPMSTLSEQGLHIEPNPDASICKAIPNKISGLQSSLSSCRSAEETIQIQKIVENTTHVMDDFKQMTASYNDLIITGDKLFGEGAAELPLNAVKDRNTELIELKEKLSIEVKKSEATAERMDRDFIDEATNTPAPIPSRTLHVIEDYTMAVFAIAYIFLAMSATYLYVQKSDFSLKSIIIGIITSSVVMVILYSLINLIV